MSRPRPQSRSPQRRTTSLPLQLTRPPLSRQVQATSWLAPANAAGHRHEAEFLLAAPYRGPCRFQLEATCTGVEAWADGVPVPLYPVSDTWQSPRDVSAQRRLTIRYHTTAPSGAFRLRRRSRSRNGPE